MGFDEVRAVADAERERIAEDQRQREQQLRELLAAQSRVEAEIVSSTRDVQDLTQPFLRAAGRRGSDVKQSPVRFRAHRGWVIVAPQTGSRGEHDGASSAEVDGVFMDPQGRFWSMHRASVMHRCVAPAREVLIRRLGQIAAEHDIVL